MRVKIVTVLGLVLFSAVSIVDSPGIVGYLGLVATLLGVILLALGLSRMKTQQ